jgi:hypothetical protein
MARDRVADVEAQILADLDRLDIPPRLSIDGGSAWGDWCIVVIADVGRVEWRWEIYSAADWKEARTILERSLRAVIEMNKASTLPERVEFH